MKNHLPTYLLCLILSNTNKEMKQARVFDKHLQNLIPPNIFPLLPKVLSFENNLVVCQGGIYNAIDAFKLAVHCGKSFAAKGWQS